MTKLDLESYKNSEKPVIKHEGVISRISEEGIIISLKGDINCEGCKAKSACGVSESNDKEIEISHTSQSFEINETVDLVLEKSLGLKAVFWAYIFPFILIMLTLVITSSFLKEWIAGILSLIVLIPYYLSLYVMKKSFQKAFQISIIKI